MTVTITPLEAVPEVEKIHPRGGKFRFRRLAKGIDGSPNNFTFEMSRTYADFVSPRHRHNFDQFRFQLEGDFDFGRDGKSVPGTLIYHPESAPYGPQTGTGESLVLVVQFGGASGNGYISSDEQRQAIAELERNGTFKDGVYIRVDEGGKKSNKDAFEAIWEHINGRHIEYAKPRYQAPIFMHKDNYAWVAVPGCDGVSTRLMGVFTERRIEAGCLRIEPGSRYRIDGAKLYFVLEGSGEADEKPIGKHTTIHVEAGDTTVVAAKEALEILFLGLPNFPVRAAQAAA